MAPRTSGAPQLLRAVSALLLAHQPAASLAAPLARPAPAAAGHWCARSSAAAAFVAPVEHGARLLARRQPATSAQPARAALLPAPRAGAQRACPPVWPGASPLLRAGRGASAKALHSSSSGASSSGRRAFSGGSSEGRGGRGGERGRDAWRSELSPSERRVLQKQRRDGSISEADRAKLSRAELMERADRDGPAGRGEARGARGVSRPAPWAPRAQPWEQSGDRVGAPPPKREIKPAPAWVAEKMKGAQPAPERVAEKMGEERRGGAGRGRGEPSARRLRRTEWNARRLENDQSGAWRDGQGMQGLRGPGAGERRRGSDGGAREDTNRWDRERNAVPTDRATAGGDNEVEDDRVARAKALIQRVESAPPSARPRAPSAGGSVRGRGRSEEYARTKSLAAEDADDDDMWERETEKVRGTLARLAPVAGFRATSAAEAAPTRQSLRDRFFPGSQAPRGLKPPGSSAAPEDTAAEAGTAGCASADAAQSALENFAGYRWDDKVLGGLQAAGITSPSPIQAAGIPVMISGANTILHSPTGMYPPPHMTCMYPPPHMTCTILHSPTGSGKTLSFLLPLIARMRASAAATGLPRPRQSLVLVPSRELALQIVAEAVNLAGADVAHLIVGGTQTVQDQLALLRSTTAPLIVASPDRLVKLLEAASPAEGPGVVRQPRGTQEAMASLANSKQEEAAGVAPSSGGQAQDSEKAGEREGGEGDVLGNLEAVVLDEVDRMLDSLSKYATARDRERRARHPKKALVLLEMIAAHHNARATPLQLVACSATVGRQMRRDLAKIDNAWGMAAFEIVTATAQEYMTDDARRDMKSARTFDRNNGPVAAGAMVPHTISQKFSKVLHTVNFYSKSDRALTFPEFWISFLFLTKNTGISS